MQVSEVPKVISSLTTGLELRYSKVEWLEVPFLVTQSMINVQINRPDFQYLERILVVSRRTPDTNQVSTCDKYVLRNGSDVDIGTYGSTVNYTNGTIAYAVDSSNNIITNPATNIAGGVLWVSHNYNGLFKAQLKWLSEDLVRESDFIYMGPYRFRNVKDWTRECFAKSEHHQCELQSYQYEGIDPTTFAWMNSNTQFILGFGFTSVKGAEMANISLSKSMLDIYLYTNTTNNVPTRTTDITLDVFLMVGGVLRFSINSVRADF